LIFFYCLQFLFITDASSSHRKTPLCIVLIFVISGVYSKGSISHLPVAGFLFIFGPYIALIL
ncbi:MAG: hypothetical protein WAP99_09380, partial [Caldicoprobacterales bacterium]